MFNPDIQYRCTIIRGKAQRELDNLLSAYSNIISEVCPCTKEKFDDEFNDKLSYLVYNKNYSQLSFAHKKTIRNHITEIAGKLFGLFFERDGLIYESQNNIKLLEDNDQPAFFKNLCLNFQFPNGTQKIQTVLERIDNDIKFKPFHFIVSLLKLAKNKDIFLTKDEIGYYVLNAKQVLQGKVTPQVVLDKILLDRSKNLVKRVGANSRDFQHIREQLNLLSLANIIVLTEQSIYLNESEKQTIELFIQGLEEPLQFDMSKYKLPYDSKKMYSEWSEYFGKINVKEYSALETNFTYPISDFSNLQSNTAILGDRGEELVFKLEKERVGRTHPKLTNKIQLVGKLRGLGYDVLSVEASENKSNPEFSRFIEVKSTTRTTEPDLNDQIWVDSVNLTRKEWIAAKQYGSSYNIYRVYFTPKKVVIRKINNPFAKSQKEIIQVVPTMYRMDFKSDSIDQEY